VNSSGADQDNAHFADLERDAESGTEHAQFRNYTPNQGRWLAPDQYYGSYDITNPQSMNRYAYVLNNPMSFTDPSGLYGLPTGPCDPTVSDCDPNPAPDPGDPNCLNPGGGTEGCIPLSCAGPYGCDGPPPPGPQNPGGPPSDVPASTSNQLTSCQQTVLDAVNNQFGTDLNANNVLPTSNPNLQPGGQVNVNFGVNWGLSATQFNTIQPGRYAPSGFWGVLTGYGPSLHVVASPSGLDPDTMTFGSSNFGGLYSVGFTAHIDSAWADNPFGFFLHLFIDVFGSKSRKPCP